MDYDGSNSTPFTEAESLLDTFVRVPDHLDETSIEAAITLAKQMKLAADDLDQARKDDTADLRDRLADQERPYKATHDKIEEARQTMLQRLGVWLKDAGKERERNSLGIMARRQKRGGWEIEDEALLPLDCWTRQPDSKKIGRLIEDGQDVPGVRRIETFKTIVS